MKIFNKLITLTLIILSSLLTCCSMETISISTRPVKAGVLLYSLEDEVSLVIKKSLEDIQKENENKIQFTFFDGKGNLATENEQLDAMIKEGFNIIIASIVDKKEADVTSEIVNKTTQKNIPLILYNSTPINLDPFKKNSKAVVINPDLKQSGVLQGQMIAKDWNANKKTLDKNNDDIMEYIMLQGKPESAATIVRTMNSISTLNKVGIKTQELSQTSAGWDRALARSSIETLFLRFNDKIEAIISNNDAMAIGAVEALQKYGYNKGDSSKFIPVYGIDGTPQAQELIKDGYMAGTVLLDYPGITQAIYKVGMNLVSNVNPLEGTNYKFDDTGAEILTPYKGYLTSNKDSN